MITDDPRQIPEKKSSWRFSTVLLLVALGSLVLMLILRGPASSDVGKPFPELNVEGWLNGPAPEPAELEGKVRIFEAWAHWCGPCLMAAPHMVELHEKYKDRGVIFIGLTGEDSRSLVKSREFLAEGKITWPNGYGASPMLQSLQQPFIPYAWVVDREGKIAWSGHPMDLKESLLDGLLR
jgi:thiol-disulfide isomerase/thioredoxin